MEIISFKQYFEHVGHNYKAPGRGPYNAICPFCSKKSGKMNDKQIADGRFPTFYCFNDSCPQGNRGLTVIAVHALLNGISKDEAFSQLVKLFSLKLDQEPVSQAVVDESPNATSEDSIEAQAYGKLKKELKMLELVRMYMHLPGNTVYVEPGNFWSSGTLKDHIVSRCESFNISKATLERVLCLKHTDVAPEVWHKTCHVIRSTLGFKITEMDAKLRSGELVTQMVVTQERLKVYADYLESMRGKVF